MSGPEQTKTPPAKCGAANEAFGLRCDREPHPRGTAHYQNDGHGISAWPAWPDHTRR